jgi:succinate dehydrogenase / fumarate reductase iron-sulfur subunit
MATAADVLNASGAQSANDHTIELSVRVRRFNPEVSEESWWDEWTVRCDPFERLVEVLHQIKWHLDGTLSFRRSCAHGICGPTAMLIDGRNQLACKVLAQDVAPRVTIEPIRGLAVLKDLIVDMDPFMDDYRSILPYLINDSGEPDKERASRRRTAPLRRHDEVHPLRGVHDVVPGLLGRRRVRRAGGDRERPPVHLRFPRRRRPRADEDPVGEDRVFRCRTTFNCTDACPRGIQVTKAIQEVKRAILFERF